MKKLVSVFLCLCLALTMLSTGFVTAFAEDPPVTDTPVEDTIPDGESPDGEEPDGEEPDGGEPEDPADPEEPGEEEPDEVLLSRVLRSHGALTKKRASSHSAAQELFPAIIHIKMSLRRLKRFIRGAMSLIPASCSARVSRVSATMHSATARHSSALRSPQQSQILAQAFSLAAVHLKLLKSIHLQSARVCSHFAMLLQM